MARKKSASDIAIQALNLADSAVKSGNKSRASRIADISKRYIQNAHNHIRANFDGSAYYNRRDRALALTREMDIGKVSRSTYMGLANG